MGMEGRGSDHNVGSNKTVMIRMGAKVAIEVMKMMELRVVGAYVLGVEIEPPTSVGWVLTLCLGAWWVSRSEKKKMVIPTVQSQEQHSL